MTARSSQERTEEALAAIPDQESLVGVFVSADGPVATVNVGTTTVVARIAGQVAPIPGDPVRLERRDGQLLLLGQTNPRAVVGKVTATGSPKCTVEYPIGSGVTAQMQFNSAYAPAVNDIVLLDWTSGGTVVCKLSTTPAPEVPGTSGGGGAQRYEQVFTAIDSGSYRFGSWWTNEVWASDNNIGAWFYGSKIRDTIPDGASIQAASIYLPPRQVLYGPPNFGRHGLDSKSGPPTISSIAPLEPRSGWVPIPLGHIDHLKANPGGLGVEQGGYTIWHGTGRDGMSGALDIVYYA